MLNLKKLDLYRKVPKELTQPTLGGAVTSILCVLFMSYLLISEFRDFITTQVVHELFVDQSNSQEKIDVRLNVSLPRLECQYAGLDIQDDAGRHEVGSTTNLVKVEINDVLVHHEPEHSDKAVALSEKKGTGCRIEMSFKINRIPGNFHLSTHSSKVQPKVIDMAHIIHEISFGDDLKYINVKGSFNPMAGISRLEDVSIETHEYHLRLVPSIYQELSGQTLRPYQFTYAHKKYVSFGFTGHVVPAIWFKYDINPISIKYVEKRRPLYEFLCMTCAIIGGTFTVAGLWAGFVNTVSSNIMEKLELGKLT